MNLRDLFLRLLDEQKWREQKAQQFSSGLGSMPYSFDETMNLKYPQLMDMYRQRDANDLHNYKKWEEMEAPDYAPHRYYYNEGLKLKEERTKNRAKLGT